MRGNGKVILLGEHAVVHGVPALAAGLSRGATARVAERVEPTLAIAPWSVEVRVGEEEPLARALEALFVARESYSSGRARRRAVDVTMELPGSAGLGSSAAIGVAVLRALDEADGIARDFDALQEIALAWERVFHGNPSGIDTAMAIAGGVALYRRRPGPGESGLELVQPARSVALVVGHSGSGASTREMVARVAQHAERDSEAFAARLAAIGALVEQGLAALREGDLDALGEAFDANHAHLSAWGVSTPTLDAMCDAARRAGALGAKLTGGGGGGCMIALVPDAATSARVNDVLGGLGETAFEVTIERTG